jgi:hypothetical protein
MKQADATDKTPRAIKMKAPETKIKAAIRFEVSQVANSWILALRCSLVCALRREAVGFSAALVTAGQTYKLS